MEFFDTTITNDAKERVLHCLNSGYISEGELVREFESKLESLFRYRGVAVNSCTSALHLALILSGVKHGDEVILPAQTFVATGMAILYCGATPVFADIDKDTGNVSVDSVSSKITSKTKAIICVSWGGNPCELYELEKICKMYGLKLIQDNAQALGATYKGMPISDFGDFSCFSFQAIKHLTTGDGGLLVCRNPDDYGRARRLRWFGIDREINKIGYLGERQYNLEEIGYKYHMNDLSAAVGIGNFQDLLERMVHQDVIADFYDKEVPYLFSGGNDIYSPNTYKVSRFSGSANWLYTVLVNKRDQFIYMMQKKGIPVSVVHVGIDCNNVFGIRNRNLSNQRYWDEHHICLPCHSGLTDEDVQKVCDAIRGGW